jgi:hypothetical protein
LSKITSSKMEETVLFSSSSHKSTGTLSKSRPLSTLTEEIRSSSGQKNMRENIELPALTYQEST